MFVSPFVLRMVGSLLFFIIGSYLITYQVFSDKPYIFITSPANAISSVSYAIVDAPLPVKIPMMVLSIASYSLWSNSITTINFVDVTSIAIVSFGFICKLLALYQNQYWGTCVFHIMSALGVWVLLKLQLSTRSEELKDNMHNQIAESVAIATYNPMGGLDPVILCNS